MTISRVRFGFEGLDVWNLAVDFADLVYSATRSFPADERFGLTNQMRRASVSVAANIAEGSGRQSNREFVRFIEIAYGSLMEVVSHSTIAARQKFLPGDHHEEIRVLADRISRMLSGLRDSLS